MEKKSRYCPLDKTTYAVFWETVRNLDIFQLSDKREKTSQIVKNILNISTKYRLRPWLYYIYPTCNVLSYYSCFNTPYFIHLATVTKHRYHHNGSSLEWRTDLNPRTSKKNEWCVLFYQRPNVIVTL